MPEGALLLRVLEIAALVAAIIFAWRLVPRAILLWRVYTGAPTRRSADAGPDPVPPPTAVAAVLSELRDQGFERLGEQRVLLPNGVVAYDWLAVDAAGTSVAGVAVVGTSSAMLICASAFANHYWLQTYFPQGESIESPDLRAQTTGLSVADAVGRHRRGIEKLRPEHGEPRRVRTIADALSLDVEFREHHLQRILRRRTSAIVREAILAVFLVGVLLTLLALDW